MKTEKLNTIIFGAFVTILIAVAIMAIAVAVTHTLHINLFNNI